MTKKLIAAATSLFLVASNFAGYAVDSDEDYSSLFQKDDIIDIKIDIDETDLQDMYDYASNEEYHSADITVDGIELENVGIRTKGNMTLRSVASSDSDRYSFRIKFNKYVKGQTLLGLNELCLNNCYSDASYMREYLHYELMREMGVDCSDTVYCNVYINGELSGFYLAVEALDKSYVKTTYDDENGRLYKMDQGSNLLVKESGDYSSTDLKVGDDDDLTEFKAFVEKLNSATTAEEFEKFLDVDSALIHIAANTVLCNYDSYNGNMKQNYYLYENDEGIWSVVPWDMNMSFGGYGGSTSVGIDTPVSGDTMDNSPLISKLLAVDEFKTKYYSYIKTMMAWLENLPTRVTELKEIIKPYVEADPTAFYTVDQFETATTLSSSTSATETSTANTGGHGGMSGTKSILDVAAARLSNLEEQFAGTADKDTSSSSSSSGMGGGPQGDRQGRGNGRDGQTGNNSQPPEMPNGENSGNGQPPEMPNEQGMGNMQPPQGMNGMGQPPETNGDMQLPEMNGDAQTSPDNSNTNGQFAGSSNNKGRAQHGMSGDFGNSGNTKNSTIRVNVNGHKIKFNQDPIIENDTTLVGFRAILEALGAEVTWDEDTQTITATKDDTTIVLTLGSTTATVNGNEVTLLAAPELVSDNTMVPVRFLSENLGMSVDWDENTKLVTVTNQ